MQCYKSHKRKKKLESSFCLTTKCNFLKWDETGFNVNDNESGLWTVLLSESWPYHKDHNWTFKLTGNFLDRNPLKLEPELNRFNNFRCLTHRINDAGL